jgi:hypothetical protein
MSTVAVAEKPLTTGASQGWISSRKTIMTNGVKLRDALKAPDKGNGRRR